MVINIHVGGFAADRERTFMTEQPFQQPVLVTFKQAAVLLSVSLRTVQRLAARGRLPVVHLTPDMPRIRYVDLLDLIRRQP